MSTDYDVTDSNENNLKMDVSQSSENILKMSNDDSLKDMSLDKDSSEDTSDDDSEEFVVVKVVGRRINWQDQLEYRVHWENFPDKDDTWEKASNLNCEVLINAFERQRSLQIGQQLNAYYKNKAKRLKLDPQLVTDNPFNLDFKAQYIVKGFNDRGEISFLIKFKDMDDLQMVPAEIAYTEIPQMVLRFYEKNCNFPNPSGQEPDTDENDTIIDLTKDNELYNFYN